MSLQPRGSSGVPKSPRPSRKCPRPSAFLQFPSFPRSVVPLSVLRKLHSQSFRLEARPCRAGADACWLQLGNLLECELVARGVGDSQHIVDEAHLWEALERLAEAARGRRPEPQTRLPREEIVDEDGAALVHDGGVR